MEKNYKPIKEGDQFTIAQWDEGYNAYIINDGIYNYYFWDTLEEAKAAAEAYNAYEGCEWLGQHGYGNDIIDLSVDEDIDDDIDDDIDEDIDDDIDEDMIALYRLFNAVEE